MEHNKQLELAWEFAEHTSVSIFLTGKAGTGKTTFLRTLRKKSAKTMIVVAPTGVAAINADGVTIHSFFQLPLSPYVPGATYRDKFNFSRNKLRIIRSLDLLVIDEISMVRADLLDAIDNALRKYRRSSAPFGGVQLLMIGDLQQLAPVVTPADEALLAPYYPNYYFFSSKALAQIPYVTIELERIYRQQNPAFVALLNNVRDDRLTPDDMQQLRQRLNPEFTPPEGSGYIRLTTHNYLADSYNDRQLALLPSKERTFSAEIKGSFPELSYPTAQQLKLKKGAQVMFLKNDVSGEGRYYNGKIGRITDTDADRVTVMCDGDDEPIVVTPEVWENARYTINEKTNQVETEVQGTFSQLPLRLAWAITIHKSQGLTFDKVVIDAGASFAPGQVYVALSRCKTLDGIVLATPINTFELGAAPCVNRYLQEHAEDASRSEAALDVTKENFLRQQLADLFKFADIVALQNSLLRVIAQNYAIAFPKQYAAQQQLEADLREHITEISNRWITAIQTYPYPTLVSADFLARVKSAAAYFREKLTEIFGTTLKDASRVQSENKKATQRLKELVPDITQAFNFKLSLLAAMESADFSIPVYLSAKQHAMLGTSKDARTVALEEKKKKMAELQARHAARQKEREAKAREREKKPKSDILTYEMFRQGYTRQQIADKRELALSTVNTHLFKHLESGDLTIEDILTPMICNVLRQAIDQATASLTAQGSDAAMLRASDIRPFLPDAVPTEDLYLFIRSAALKSSRK